MALWEIFWSDFPSSGIWLAAIWWLALCGITAWLAHGKGRNRAGFFAVAFFFSPIVGLLAVMAARDLRGASDAQMARDEFRELLGPLILQVDGIRGHLAVGREAQRVAAPAAAPPAPPKRPAVAPPPAETNAPRPEAVWANGASPS
jgi:hypothetical protein